MTNNIKLKDCFKGIIGVRNFCKEMDDEFEYYLEDFLPLPFPLIADFTSSTYISASNLINAKTNLAFKKVAKTVLGKLQTSNSMTFNTVIEGAVFGEFSDKYELDTFKGFRGPKFYSNSKSAFHCFFINEIRFQACTNVACQIFEVLNEKGQVLDSFKAEVKAGQIICIPVGKSYSAQQLWVRTTNQNLLVNASTLKFRSNGCCTTQVGNCIKSAGYDGLNNYINETFGFQVDIELRCCEENMICWLAPRLGLAAGHQLAIELLNELISPNGRFTLIKLKADQQDWAREEIATNDQLVKRYIKQELAGIQKYLRGMSGQCGCITCHGPRVVGRMP